MEGKSISRRMETLDDGARELGVRPPSELFGVSPVRLEEFIDAGADDIKPPPLQQFSADEGLKTIHALNSHAIARKPGITEDLKECERILNAAAQHGIGWHFKVDL